jgi:three-Cys-motif partner protein
MKGNPRAAHFRTVYFDAFAGSGIRSERALEPHSAPLLVVDDDQETTELLKGSTHVALETTPPFDQYIFVEKNAEYAKSLEHLRETFPTLSDRIHIAQGEGNDLLVRWCKRTDWKSTRAVVFLDPYGMQVDWSTIAAIAKTQAIDLWILFPLGQGVNRLLTREGPPPLAWADRLTRFFGTDQWKARFYQEKEERDLFGITKSIEKEADFDAIGNFFLERLRSVFSAVASRTLPLRNSRGTPIYLLCFAAGNKKGAPTAVKIANGIIEGWGKRRK